LSKERSKVKFRKDPGGKKVSTKIGQGWHIGDKKERNFEHVKRVHRKPKH